MDSYGLFRILVSQRPDQPKGVPPPPVYICQLRNLLHPPAVVTYLSIKFWCQVFAKPNKKMGGKQMNPSSR